MNAFTVHEPPNPPADRLDRAEEMVFVRDSFSFAAALLPPLWLATKRLWLPLVGYLLAFAAILGLAYALGLAPGWVTLLILALDLIVGFEADTLERYGLERRGYTTIGTVVGRNLDECERRFFDDWLPGQPMIAPVAAGGAGSLAGPKGEALGHGHGHGQGLSLWRRFLRGRAQ